MLMSLGLADMWYWWRCAKLRRPGRAWASDSARARRIPAAAKWERGILVGALAVVVSCADLALLVGLPSRAAADPLEALPAGEREAMAWIADQTPSRE